MITASEEKAEAEAVAPDAKPETLRRQARTRAISVALPPETASATALDSVTERVRQAGEIASKAAALLDRPGSLAHSQPPTFRQAWDRQMECARHYGTPAVRWLRALWGAVHVLLVKPGLNLAEWVCESPARFVTALAILAAIWIWS